MPTPPVAVPHGSVIIRRWRAHHAQVLHESVLASLGDLRAWMPWAASEPIDLADRRRLVAQWIEGWDADGGDFGYGVWVDVELVGACGLHRRGQPSTFDIGYWIRSDRTGRGHATEAVLAAAAAAFAVDGVEQVRITHDAANERSRAVAERAGFRWVGEQDDEICAPSELGRSVIWVLERHRFEAAASDRSRS